MPHSRWFLVPVVLLGVWGFVSMRRNAPPALEVIQVRPQSVTRTLAITGTVEAIAEASLSSSLNGALVRRVLADKGDRVRRGQPLIELDDREYRAALLRANALLRQAQANLLRAQIQRTGSNRSLALTKEQNLFRTDLKIQRDNAATALASSKERLTQAKEALSRIKEGARKQAVRAAQAQVRRAEAQLKWNDLALKRSGDLLRQGATSQAEYDLAKTNYDVAQEALNAAKEEASQLAEPRTEDVRQAEAQTREAEAAEVGAQKNLSSANEAYQNRTALRLGLATAQTESQAAEASLLAAEADIARARAEQEQAAAQIAKTVLRSPVDGIVTARQAEAGETVSAGRILLTVVEPNHLRVRVDVDETNIGEIKAGQKVTLVPDALPDQRIEGVVDEIIPSANSERGTVEARIRLKQIPPRLMPRLTVDVNIVTNRYNEALLLPRSSVLDPETQPYVLTVVGDKVIEKRVKIAKADFGRVVVLEGVGEQDRVILTPQKTKAGATVLAKPTVWETAK